MKRRGFLAGALASGGPFRAAAGEAGAAVVPASRRAAGGPPFADMYPTFDYVPARDGLSLLRGGPTQAGYTADAATRRDGVWQPRFSTELSPKGHGNVWNGEYQFYADPEYPWSNGFTPFAIIEGVLRIRAERTARLGFRPGEIPVDPHTRAPYGWVSGVLNSRRHFSQQGGYFEIDAKMPKGVATWPAFWLLPTDEVHPPEIDVVEYLGHEPTKYRGNCISIGPSPDESTFDVRIDLSAGFHRYGILWTDTAVGFYLDGIELVRKSIVGRREYWQPFYLIVNLAIGSRRVEWVPAPTGATPDPADMLVRTIRVWQKAGPRGVVLSADAVLETAPLGTAVAELSCLGIDEAAKATFALRRDEAESFAVSGNVLKVRAPLSFLERPYHDLIIEAADGRGRTWQHPVSIAVLDGGAAPNALAAGSGRSFAHPAWSKIGVRVVPDPGTGTELLLERPVTAAHSTEQLVRKAASAKRYIVSADLKPHGREWVKFEISRNYGKNVQAVFNVATGEIGHRQASLDSDPFGLNDCRAIPLDDGFFRCQVDVTTDAGTTLRTSLKLVTDRSGDGMHAGDPAKGVLSRSFSRVVEVGAGAPR